MKTTIPKPCPDCGATGSLTLSTALVAKPMGTWSLAGAQLKTSAREVAVLACSACGASRRGHLEDVQVDASGVVTGGHFVADEPGAER